MESLQGRLQGSYTLISTLLRACDAPFCNVFMYTFMNIADIKVITFYTSCLCFDICSVFLKTVLNLYFVFVSSLLFCVSKHSSELFVHNDNHLLSILINVIE